jgi:hypothetical protein
MKQQRVDATEDGRVRPDAESDGEHSDTGKTRLLRQHPKRVSQIL